METVLNIFSLAGLRPLAAALAVALPLTAAVAPAAVADEEQASPLAPEAGELALEGIDKLMRALEIFISTIPQYGAPFIDDQGNIVIPRVGDPADPKTTDPVIEETGTTT